MPETPVLNIGSAPAAACESFYALAHDMSGDDVCQGLACFVARHLNPGRWQQACSQSGELYATFHTARVFLNNITSLHRDRYTKTPEYKVTAVRLEKV